MRDRYLTCTYVCMKFRKSASSFSSGPNCFSNSAIRVAFVVKHQRLFAGKDLQVGDILLGVLMDEIIGQGPGLGIGVDDLLRVHQAVIAADERFERVGRPLLQILLELSSRVRLTTPMPAQPFLRLRSGVSQYMAMPSLNHLGQSLNRWCRPLLKAIWCVASWTIVETVPGALGLARNWLMCASADRPARAVYRHARQIVHDHPIALHVVVAEDRVRGVAQILLRVLDIRRLIGKNDRHEAEFGLDHLKALAAPGVAECRVKPFEQRPAPLGVGPRGVVDRSCNASSGRP